MSKKLIVAALFLLLTNIFLSACGINKHTDTAGSSRSDLSAGEVRQITISTSMRLFDEIEVTDKEQISSIIDYLASLNLIETKLDPRDYTGMAYQIKIKSADNKERTVSLYGNKFFIEEGRPVYELHYEEAIKFETIVGKILQARQSDSGEASITGTVMSIKAEASGRNISCIIKDDKNKSYTIDMANSKIIDATGHGWMILHEGDVIRAFYKGDVPADSGDIHSTTVFIQQAAQ